MKVSLWNTRGTKRNNFWTEIEIFCKNEHVQVMAIVETKSEQIPEEIIWRKAGFNNIIWSPAIGRAGGICILLKQYQLHHVQMELIKQEERFIAVKYNNIKTKVVCAIIFAYAPPNERDKPGFWSKIEEFINNSNIPCMIIGDLN